MLLMKLHLKWLQIKKNINKRWVYEKARDFTLRILKLLLKLELRILPDHIAFFLMMAIILLVALIPTLSANLSISPEGMS